MASHTHILSSFDLFNFAIIVNLYLYLHFDYYIGGSSRVTTGAFHLSENVGWLDVFDYLTR